MLDFGPICTPQPMVDGGCLAVAVGISSGFLTHPYPS